ncbi:MAG TPA: malate synthase A, partial [Stellaceae bacterium]|nr:malate synthase A [Stellaceae bacterium]
RVLGERPNQKSRLRAEVVPDAVALQEVRVPGGTLSEEGVRNAVSVALQYIDSWLSGNGAAAIYNLMEDAATAEISRAQVWQWTRHGARLADGRIVDAALSHAILAEELAKIAERIGADAYRKGHYEAAAALFRDLIDAPKFIEFLTLPAYQQVVAEGG